MCKCSTPHYRTYHTNEVHKHDDYIYIYMYHIINYSLTMNRLTLILILLYIAQTTIAGFIICNRCQIKIATGLHATNFNSQTDFGNPSEKDSPVLEVGRYKHKHWNLTYLYKQPAPGREKDPPIILVHPVGVGISSWFYKKLMLEYTDNPPLYAPDLIGCGLGHGADAWDPEKIGLFFPLSWVEGVESLINEVALPRWTESQEKTVFLFRNYWDTNSATTSKKGGCLVLVQGGLVRLWDS